MPSLVSSVDFFLPPCPCNNGCRGIGPILSKVKSSYYFCGRGYYDFLFELKEDRGINFRIGPYFIGLRGIFLNFWTLNFDIEVDVLNFSSMWVWFPHLITFAIGMMSMMCPLI